LNELDIPYEIRDLTSNPAYAEELKATSGPCMSPSIDVDGMMRADAGWRIWQRFLNNED
jgi:hypothetical protein